MDVNKWKLQGLERRYLKQPFDAIKMPRTREDECRAVYGSGCAGD